MAARKRNVLIGLSFSALVVALLPHAGADSDILSVLPVLLFALPLLGGWYVGEERLVGLARRFDPAGGKHAAAPLGPTVTRSATMLPRGGCLMASFLAVRPPPARLQA